jgi:hypothetical protein
MSLRQIRKLIVLPLIVVLAIGVLYLNFSSSATASLPPAGPSMLGMEMGEGQQAVARTPEPLTYDITGPVVGELVYPASYDGDVRDLPQIPPALVAPLEEMPSPHQGRLSTDLNVETGGPKRLWNQCHARSHCQLCWHGSDQLGLAGLLTRMAMSAPTTSSRLSTTRLPSITRPAPAWLLTPSTPSSMAPAPPVTPTTTAIQLCCMIRSLAAGL